MVISKSLNSIFGIVLRGAGNRDCLFDTEWPQYGYIAACVYRLAYSRLHPAVRNVVRNISVGQVRKVRDRLTKRPPSTQRQPRGNHLLTALLLLSLLSNFIPITSCIARNCIRTLVCTDSRHGNIARTPNLLMSRRQRWMVM